MRTSQLKILERKFNLFEQSKLCCVCGQTNCNQSIDHEKVQFVDLKRIIQKHVNNRQKIDLIKKKFSQFYREIKLQIIKFIEKDQIQMQTYINEFYFSKEFFFKNSIDIKFISQILEKNVQKLPNKKMIKIIKKLKNVSMPSQHKEYEQIQQKTSNFLEFFNIQSVKQKMKADLPLQNVKYYQITPKLKSKTSISQITNPQQTDLLDLGKIYQWRNVKVTKNSRTAALSNKNISDRQVMKQIPILGNYKNLQEIEIRNNKVSCLTCNIIANNMPFLHSVDVRGNKIFDKGIIKLINGIPRMKSFFISETYATDESGQQIASKLPELQMFWSEHTKITNQIALKIAQKPKLKVLSLMGNPIDDQHKEKMKKIFISKGYITF